jgi:hypothetical protein
MLSATVLAIFFVPVFFVATLKWLKGATPHHAASPEANDATPRGSP